MENRQRRHLECYQGVKYCLFHFFESGVYQVDTSQVWTRGIGYNYKTIINFNRRLCFSSSKNLRQEKDRSKKEERLCLKVTAADSADG